MKIKYSTTMYKYSYLPLDQVNTIDILNCLNKIAFNNRNLHKRQSEHYFNVYLEHAFYISFCRRYFDL